MMKRCLLSVLFAACVLLSGCGANDSPAQESDPNPPAQEQPLDPSGGSDASITLPNPQKKHWKISAEKIMHNILGKPFSCRWKTVWKKIPKSSTTRLRTMPR